MHCASFFGDSKRSADASARSSQRAARRNTGGRVVVCPLRAANCALSIALLLCSATAISPAFAAEARFDIPQKSFLVDEVVPIVVSGVPPGGAVAIQLRSSEWESSGDFRADANGVVDLTKTADPMQLFWSAQRSSSRMPPDTWELTASIGGKTVATTTVERRAVAPDVKVTRVREHGLVGDFYQPAGEGKHPAILVLGGSGGGLPPANGQPGGLSSRGYAVLALAYFGVEGLPSSLSYIPLEYFATALDWLAAQPSVDPARIGVSGTSRGAELALLLASIAPRIRTVIAYMPSSVAISGCCDGRGEPAWTLSGHPVTYILPRMQGDFLARQRAAIPVERIHGAVLLISGTDDQIWASDTMSEEIMNRLRRNNFAFPFQHLSYDHAGHDIGRPFTSTMDVNSVRHPLTGRMIRLGGTPAGTAHARADSWPKVLAFLDENLRR